ncbi:dTDP-4-dehydrorhamnose 3,5-epimerase [Ephemeroptericola cinctiostellae]|uniref:dTDP-4-dehydrorhamnose 3,5-epimerase n=1 Tax=Ephemeroptericola cinctiostellae TaxID=2268024 RepID=A0A345DA31_9BURK|nr:dTDP-4-dehydrorhamnose 3,5-epimerase [Ephemeroptericola cinctiostellae]AXF85219.1 dTDP-4-dehydrorhamnose 3,5-epimerase [Ephemeroptericola cinctiostellae]
MNIIDTIIPEVKIIEPAVFGDARGFFFESFNEQKFQAATHVNLPFVQDNHSRSSKGVLRGLHYQIERAQGKLVRVVSGAVIDVAVDLRRSSPTFKQWVAVELSADNHRQLWVPPGFGHGFVVISDTADFLYKTTDYWFKEHERAVRWDDPTLAVDWGYTGEVSLSAKDMDAPYLVDAELFE